MSSILRTETRHGVMVCINDQGVLITGPAGIGKSSLALALIRQGHQLIADDVVDISLSDQQLTATCPAILKGLLHSRELGTLNVRQLFGQRAYRESCPLDFVLELCSTSAGAISLEARQPSVDILQIPLSRLSLSITNPASVVSRLLTWLAMQSNTDDANQTLKQRQQQQMQ